MSDYNDNGPGSNEPGGNVFSSDPKDDFGGNFGGNGGSGMLGGMRGRVILIAVAAAAAIGGGFYYLTSTDESAEEMALEDNATDGKEHGKDHSHPDKNVADNKKGDLSTKDHGTDGHGEIVPDGKDGKKDGGMKDSLLSKTDKKGKLSSNNPNLPTEPAHDDHHEPMVHEEAAPVAESKAKHTWNGEYGGGGYGGGATGRPTLTSPAEGAVRVYDETASEADFTWEGGGGQITFARTPNMNPAVFTKWVRGGHYNFHMPYPGTWYWKVRNNYGNSEIRTFRVEPPPPRQIVLLMPQAGQAIPKGGTVAWTGDNKVSYYRVEVSSGNSWSSPTYTFATAGTQLQVQGLTPGQYLLRVGGFSEVSGRWEYTQPVNVNVE